VDLLQGTFVLKENGCFRRNAKNFSAHMGLNEDAKALEGLLIGKCKIIKQPKLTPAEKTILENLPKEYEWIVRLNHGDILCTDKKPSKEGSLSWYNYYNSATLSALSHLFKFIKEYDQEPYNIKELLGE
jgi:hypothetical protein